jgi:hypothetical protein
MSLSFSWQGYARCEVRSPAFEVGGVPPGTKQLEFNMVDESLRHFPPDGGSVPYRGHGAIPAGAFKYVGPCPNRPHLYRWTVSAIDRDGKVLALATATGRFPP